MPASQRLSLETNVIPDSSVVDKIPLHKHQHHLHNTMGNHESFLMCPGRRPVKIGSNQPVSINIFLDNFIQRKNNDNNNKNNYDKRRDNREIYLRIKDGGIENNNYNNGHNHHANNHINAYHNNKLMNGGNSLKADATAEITSINSDRMQNNLIKKYNNNNNNHEYNNSNNDNKNIIENDGNVKHFINIYHWIVHSVVSDENFKRSGVDILGDDDDNENKQRGKPKIVVRSSSVDNIN